MTSKKIAALAYYQIAGGFIGIGLTIWLIVQTPVISGILLLILVIAFGLYGFSCYAGWQLLEGRTERGLTLSTINQYLQLIYFSLPGYAYGFISGIKLAVGLDFTNEARVTFDASLSEIHFNISGEGDVTKVLVNLFAIFVIFYIGKIEHALALEAANASSVREQIGVSSEVIQ